MINLTPQQKKRLVGLFPELSTYFTLQEIKEKKPEDTAHAEAILVALINKIHTLKGDKGDTPIKGKDYFTSTEINQFLAYILKEATPQKGIHYKDGENGKDYILTSKDKKDIARQIDVPIVEKVIEKTETIQQVMPKSIDVSIVKGAVSKKELEIEKKDILNGMAKVDGKIKLIDQRWHGGGLSKVSTDATLTGNGTPSSPLSVVGGGSGFQLPITGSVNGSNQTFTWATAPNAIVVDGVTLQATEQGGTVNWTGTTTTVMTVPPVNSIMAVA